jgi:hypothetical protein
MLVQNLVVAVPEVYYRQIQSASPQVQHTQSQSEVVAQLALPMAATVQYQDRDLPQSLPLEAAAVV